MTKCRQKNENFIIFWNVIILIILGKKYIDDHYRKTPNMIKFDELMSIKIQISLQNFAKSS
jgi:hypothetical protein